VAETKITLELKLWELQIIIKALEHYWRIAPTGDERYNAELLLGSISCGYNRESRG